jgi:hypothetical protein
VYELESMWPPSYPLSDDPDKGRLREKSYRAALWSKTISFNMDLFPGEASSDTEEVPPVGPTETRE